MRGLSVFALSTQEFVMSVALTLGRAIGRTAATAVHGAAVAVSATGQFGVDVAKGTADGYADHNARFTALRAKAAAMSAPEAPIAVAIVAKAPRTAKA
jgi:hypothetical protein